ncbi:MAG: nuclear transport factor 2 family protein [Alphaproteobacteria bacterium]|nr:nuclear transport factor 2 family protein [Alphaproteobacteria bacterium]MBU1513086.1 nuclear transport factor 2 family protein [Alphaproteobacteria bacterium]MBU2095194.1 nuclear transport factor 2 family protein [Alphaproteobacteria bacterium]MBU2150647.1 nuclear transport factor 2 family protein [Alphaproteobacteria bacterium]MBU2306094.1 nuclear transport factor 2 family protein [Alphaproteobacteria bacterium]
MGRCYTILQRVIEAWQAKDIDRVLAFMDDEIIWHYAAAAMPPVRGKAAARKLLERFQADMHGIQWRIFAYSETGDRLFLEGVDDYTTTDGHRVATPYAGVLDFRGDLIVGWRDYVDLGVAAEQKAGAPLSRQVESLLDRPIAS